MIASPLIAFSFTFQNRDKKWMFLFCLSIFPLEYKLTSNLIFGWKEYQFSLLYISRIKKVKSISLNYCKPIIKHFYALKMECKTTIKPYFFLQNSYRVCPRDFNYFTLGSFRFWSLQGEEIPETGSKNGENSWTVTKNVINFFSSFDFLCKYFLE